MKYEIPFTVRFMSFCYVTDRMAKPKLGKQPNETETN